MTWHWFNGKIWEEMGREITVVYGNTEDTEDTPEIPAITWLGNSVLSTMFVIRSLDGIMG